MHLSAQQILTTRPAALLAPRHLFKTDPREAEASVTPLLVPKLQHFLSPVWGGRTLLTSRWPLSRLSLAQCLGSPCPSVSPRPLMAVTQGMRHGRGRIHA